MDLYTEGKNSYFINFLFKKEKKLFTSIFLSQLEGKVSQLSQYIFDIHKQISVVHLLGNNAQDIANIVVLVKKYRWVYSPCKGRETKRPLYVYNMFY